LNQSTRLHQGREISYNAAAGDVQPLTQTLSGTDMQSFLDIARSLDGTSNQFIIVKA
jgi:hypothetical protein